MVEMEEQKRTKLGQIAGTIGLCCNLLLAVLKLIVGIASGMISIIADSVNNFSDSVSSIVTLIGFRIASKPADEDHPFGHARYEYISGLVVAFLVMIAGVELLKESIEKIIHPQDLRFAVPMYVVLVLSIVIKLTMMIVYTIVGKKIKSSVLSAARQDSRNDVLATSAVLISAVISNVKNINLDGITGALVAAIVLISGIGLVKETVDPLIGLCPDPELAEEFEKSILSYEGILGTHDLMIHDYGPGHRFASVHVEVPAERGIIECHEIVDKIERELSEKYKMQVLIHYDPIFTEGDKVDPVYAYMKKQARDINENISIHDMRIVPGEEKVNVIFDCVIPKNIGKKDAEVISELEKRLKKEYENYELTVTVDHGFVLIDNK
jgi:cation diffusion facilitator family transporter